MLTWIIALFLLILSTLAFVLAVVGANVIVGLLRHGPRAVEDAYRRGDSVEAWWDPSKTTPIAGPQHDNRAGLAGRRSAKRGVVAVTEHASDNVYGT